MKLIDVMKKLNEGISVHSEGLLAFAITVAEAYFEAPVLQAEQAWRWSALVYSNDILLRKAASKVKITYTENDPYANEVDMLKDIVFNKRLFIYSGHSDNHPKFSANENVVFRTIHDYFAHAAKNAKSMEAFYKKQQLVSPQEAAGAIRDFEFSHSGFNLRGEINSYLAHAKLVPPDVLPALFTEIIGQVCCVVVTGDFPTQKVAVLEGFDFRNIGKVSGPREQRMAELLEIINDPNQPGIPTKVNGIVIDKSKINWAGISPGAGAVKAKQAAAAQPQPARESRVMEMAGANIGHIRDWMGKSPYMVLSGWRGNNSRTVNNQRNNAIRKQLFSNYQLAAIEQDGFWPEKDHEGNRQGTGHEQSLFIPLNQPGSTINSIKDFFALAKKLMFQYDQDAVIFNTGSATYLVNNPNREHNSAPYVMKIGNGIKIGGSEEDLGDDAQYGFSGKKSHKYAIVDKPTKRNIP